MKKVLVLAVMAVMFVCGQVQAQWIVGGSLGLNTVKDGVTEYSIFPEIGYSVNDKLELGLGIGYSAASSDDFFYSDTSDDEIKDWSSFSVAPFARYKAFSLGKFGLWFKGIVSISTLSETAGIWEYDAVLDEDVLVEKDLSGTGVEVYIHPMVTYDFSEKISFFTNLNLLNINFSSWSGDYDTTSFGFGVDGNYIVRIGDITVGFLYRF